MLQMCLILIFRLDPNDSRGDGAHKIIAMLSGMIFRSTPKQALLFSLIACGGSAAAFACLQFAEAFWAMIFWLIAISIAWEDMRFLTVSHLSLLLLAICGVLQSAMPQWGAANGPQLAISLGGKIANAAMLGLGFYSIALIFRLIRRKEGLGLGDILLVAAAGLWMPVETVLRAVGLASIAALALLPAAALRRGCLRPDGRIPLATFLAPSLWFAWMVQQLPVR